MKIARSLLEPIGIPWWDIVPYRDKKAIAVHDALVEHMCYRIDNDYIPHINPTVSPESILECLRIIAKRGGGRYPIGMHKKVASGHLYTMSYQIRRKHSRVLVKKYSIVLPDKQS